MAHTERDIENALARPVVLALETATMCGSVALVKDNRCIAEYSLQTNETHSRRLLTAVDWLLQESSLKWHDIAAVAVSQGPGSFTGLRIGLSTAKGLVMASGCEMVGVPTLDGLAAQLHGVDKLICVMLDARKKEIFCALYRCDEAGIPQRQSDYMVMPPDQFCAGIDEPLVIIGDGGHTYKDRLRLQLQDFQLLPETTYYPRAATIGKLAIQMLDKRQLLDPQTAVPIYIRKSEAEMNYGK